MIVGKSFLEFRVTFSFLNLQNTTKNNAAKALLNQIINGVGRFMCLPKTPDVLINNVAKPNNNR